MVVLLVIGGGVSLPFIVHTVFSETSYDTLLAH